MPYSEEVYERAAAAQAQKRRTAQLLAEAHKAEVYAALPEIREIDRVLQKSAVSLSRLVLSGGAALESSFDELREHNLAVQERRGRILENSGFPSDYTEPKVVCSKCGDTGRVNGVTCSCLRELCRIEAQRELENSSGAAQCSFDNFSLIYYPDQPDSASPRKRMGEIFELCRGYAGRFSLSSPSIMMAGKTGLGKTHLSLAIARCVVDKGFGVIYGTAQKFIDSLEHERFGRGEEGSLEKLIACDLLIIDDLGAEFSTSFTSAAIGNLVSSRLLERRPTIINTNLMPPELAARYSERTASRLFGEFRTLIFTGDDIRLQKLNHGRNN